jgi:hypothetical protein
LNKEDALLEYEERKMKTHISLCAWDDVPLIRLYENWELTEEVYYNKDWIKIETIISTENRDIKIPDITKVYNISKQILEQYNDFEICTICLSDFNNIDDLLNHIWWDKRDLKKRLETIIKISEYYNWDDYKFSEFEKKEYRELYNLL